MCSAVEVVLQGALRIEGGAMEKARANKLPLWVPYPAWLGTYRGVAPALLEVRGLPGEAAAGEGSKAYQGPQRSGDIVSFQEHAFV